MFVDNGLLRLNEAQQVMDMFGDHFGLNIVHVEGEQRFLDALKGENDPEAKRKIIGRVFVEVFDEEALKLEDVKWLAQGTIYPDVIESAASATGKAHVIKSHHNVGGLPKEMKMGLVEPLRELFKDEVRKIGLELGLPYDMLYRHPFRDRGWAYVCLAKLRKSTATCCVARMLSSLKNCTKLTCTTKSAGRSPCSCRYVPLASWAMAVSTTGLFPCVQ